MNIKILYFTITVNDDGIGFDSKDNIGHCIGRSIAHHIGEGIVDLIAAKREEKDVSGEVKEFWLNHINYIPTDADWIEIMNFVNNQMAPKKALKTISVPGSSR